MLKIRFGDFTEDCIVNIKGYFKVKKKRDWFNTDNVKRIIKVIDKSDAIKDEYIESPILGAISPDRLSTGCKATILMEVLENPHIYGTKCGDNCVPEILRIAETKDVTLTLHHVMEFPEEFKAYLVEYDKMISNREEFIDAFFDFESKSR